ncbi:nucleotidyltransferase domain-containing protein [Candidatus Micrarchaeota archaeon]|nr:nucleotidyltransferase domain-containing protein [Candidatus Micrarchaeota archaeon]
MFGQYSFVKALGVVLADPSKEFSVRGLGREAQISPSAAKAALDYFEDFGLTQTRAFGRSRLVKADLENPLARQWKALIDVEEIQVSGIVREIIEKLSPSSITLYGSIAKGTGDKKSDIDLLAIASGPKKKISLSGYEAKLKRSVSLIIATPFEWKRKAEKDKIFYERVMLDSIQLYGDRPVVL